MRHLIALGRHSAIIYCTTTQVKPIVLLLLGIGWTAMKPHAPVQNVEVRRLK